MYLCSYRIVETLINLILCILLYSQINHLWLITCLVYAANYVRHPIMIIIKNANFIHLPIQAELYGTYMCSCSHSSSVIHKYIASYHTYVRTRPTLLQAFLSAGWAKVTLSNFHEGMAWLSAEFSRTDGIWFLLIIKVRIWIMPSNTRNAIKNTDNLTEPV